ncbi:MAG: hypothetical protein AB1896_19035 [Thermodesulfobacteriota bacterium]
MKRPTTAILAVAAVVLLLWTPVPAADQPQPGLKLDQVAAVAFDALLVDKSLAHYGVAETLSPEGKVLLLVKATILVQWTEEIERADIPAEEIKLVLEGGQEVLMTGYFERYGQFRLTTNGFYQWRASDWKERPEPAVYNAVFAVPRGTRTAEFRLGQASAQIEVPARTTPAPDPAETVKIEVVSAAVVKEVPNTRSVGDLEPNPATVVTNPSGELLEVKIKVTPVTGNGDDPDHFFWYTAWIALLTDQGRWCPTFGEMFMGGLSDGVSHNQGRGADGLFDPDEVALYFAVPKGAKSFKLYYLGRPLAEGRL